MSIDKVTKRSGRVVDFDRRRIEKAVHAAARAVGNGGGRSWAETISWAVTGILEERFGQNGRPPHVEEIQDVVEEVLIKSGHPQVAKAYILYRQKRAEARATERMLMDTEKLVDDYLQKLDWRVNENSNMNYSLQGLNFYLASSIAARYWLHKTYPPEVQQAHSDGEMHIHDLGMLSGYTYYGQEVVVFRDADGIRLISFEQLYTSCPEPEVPLNEADGAFAKYPRDGFVLDKDGWTRVTRLVRKSKNRPMRCIKNHGGRSVIVTDNHPMITPGGERFAADVRPGTDALYTVNVRRLLPGADLFPAAALSSYPWLTETRDEWHVVLNNEPTDIPDDEIYDITTESGTLIVNGMWNHNCAGWDLQDLLIQGFGGVPAKIESRPPKHLRTALGQLVNFFYTLQGEVAGAVAVSNFDTLLAPFIRYDKLDYTGVKQAVQEFVYNINVPTRVGFQSLVWEELVLVRRNGRIEPVEIGRLVDEQFARNDHRVLTQGHESFAVANADDVQSLAFDADGSVRWVPVKAFVRHRVPQGSTFVRMRTSRGTAAVSQAHSMFAFEKLNGRLAIRPVAAHQVEVAHGNANLTPTNHLVAIRRVPNGGTRAQLDLVGLIDSVPQLAERVRVCLPDHAAAVERLKAFARARFGGLTAFYLEYGLKDKGCWRRWAVNRSLPYRVWRSLGADETGAEFALRNSTLWYARTLERDRLREFVRLLGWYIAEGHHSISDGLYVSQARGGDQDEMVRVLGALGALGRVEDMRGWSPQGNPTHPVLRMAGKGLLAALIGFLGGTSSTNKVISWFVYDLAHELQEEFIATLLRGDGSEFPGYWDYTTTSKRLSLGFSLLLAMNGYKFSVYESSSEREAWSDQYTLRIQKDKAAGEGYASGDLLGRVCNRREPFVYEREYEYDLSVDTPLENFCGGSGLLCFHNTPFTNVTMDLTAPSTLRDQAVIIAGKPQEATYGEFHEEMDLLNRAFAEVMLEGDANGRVHTFPIPTYNATRDFDWNSPALEPVWAMTAKYGIPYFSNYINSDMNPEDARSMCCRLRLDNRELRKRAGGLFAAAPLTGSAGVVTINMPRIAYQSHDEADFQQRLEKLMETARTSLEIKRKVLEQLTERGLYPYSRHYLRAVKDQTDGYWSHHFSTIGLIGMNEACLNLIGVGIAHPEGKALAIRTLQFMREVLTRFQLETGNLYNLEATPAEGASYRLARADKKEWPDIITAGTEQTPYYTNSTHLQVGYSDDLFSVLDHQDDLQTLYTGGTVLHIFLGERLHDWRQARKLVRTVAENYRLPYFTLTPTFSICPVHGYIAGEHKYCPYEHTEEQLARYGVEVGKR